MPSLVAPQSLEDSSNRVILLLDLDCFYAQAECLRLGYDATVTPLALLQWNSVLAVTYPARQQFKIKRGDSWDIVRAKSQGQCLAVHVPILTTQDAAAASETPPSLQSATRHASLKDEYQAIFETSVEQREVQRQRELGVRRFSHQGKASIERYRIASARIFAVVQECLEQQHLNVILERASIDEFFLDVTKACASVHELYSSLQTALNETVMTGNDKKIDDVTKMTAQEDPGYLLALQRGCRIAHYIRTSVYSRLGFTLSAGISVNKTCAKLSASYGKPNGQALTLPIAIPHVLAGTKFSSCRNLGGKLGARVQALLPPNVPVTVGSIAHYLSLDDLQRGLVNADTARWVYQVVRGIDLEPVVSKTDSAALTKSITAFKSLPFLDNSGNKESRHSLADAAPWIRLLAQEVVERVERDARRHSRYPRSCNVQYNAGTGQTNNKSIRMDFPGEAWSTQQKIAHLCQRVPELIGQKEGNGFTIHRVGLCAENFCVRETSHAIDTYFTTIAAKPRKSMGDHLRVEEDTEKESEKAAPSQPSHSIDTSSLDGDGDRDLEFAKRLQASYDRENLVLSSSAQRTSICEAPIRQEPEKKPSQEILQSTGDETTESDAGADLELAKKLQASYDRENTVLQMLDKKRTTVTSQRPPKTRRIESFFAKR